MILGALIFLAGLLSGVAVRSLPARGRTVAPTCQCTHPRALHDPKTNRCHHQTNRYSSAQGEYSSQCTCRQYVGPEPLPAVFSTGIELPEVTK